MRESARVSGKERERVKERWNFDVNYIRRRRRQRVSTTRATDGQRACVYPLVRVCTCACVCVYVCGSWPGPVRARAFRPLIGWLRHRSPRCIRAHRQTRVRVWASKRVRACACVRARVYIIRVCVCVPVCVWVGVGVRVCACDTRVRLD